MDQPINDDSNPLVRRLKTIFSLTGEEEAAIGALPMIVREISRHEDIVRDHDRPTRCCVVLDGYLFRYKTSRDAKRQILALHVPGEIPDAHSLYLKTMDHTLAALTRGHVGFIEHSALFELMGRFPHILGALWRDTLIDAAIFRAWVGNLGIKPASKRMAHLFCEIYIRLDRIGLVQERSVYFPATQEDLGDMLGISAVHTNRALQELRSQGQLAFEAGRLTIRNWNSLAEYCDFDPTYLHLDRESGVNGQRRLPFA